MTTRTYYEVLHMVDNKPIGAQVKKLGTAAYGYKTQRMAEKHCPEDCYVQERHSENGWDWSGRIVATHNYEMPIVRWHQPED